ncbi:hypothetical protein Tco_0368306 [Tanacetum coccineum]
MGLWYPKDSGFELIAFDHAGCLDTCKSTSDGIQFLALSPLEDWEVSSLYKFMQRSETKEGLCKELQFSLVDNSKLNVVILILVQFQTMSKRSKKCTRGEASSSQTPSILDKIHGFGVRGETRTISLLEFGWRVGLYDEEVASHEDTVRTLRSVVTVRKKEYWRPFWPTIGNDRFIVGSTIVSSIRDPRVRLAHRCLTTTISVCGSSTHRITALDIFYLYCIYFVGVVCNIPFWLARYLKKVPRVFPKKSLILMGVVMELDGGNCVWPAIRGVGDNSDDEEDEEVGDHARAYRDMSRGAWMIGIHESVDISEESEPEPAKKKTGSRSTRGVVIQDPPKQEAADIMQALKESKKTSRRQPGIGGLSEGTGRILRFPMSLQSSLLSHMKELIKSEQSDDSQLNFDDKEKKDKDGDVDDDGDDHISHIQDQGDDEEVDWIDSDEDEEKKDDIDDDKSINLKMTDDEETNDEFVHGVEQVNDDEDEEMTNTEVEESGNGDEENTDAAKTDAGKTEEVKDDAKKAPTSSSLSVSLGFVDRFIKLSSDTSLSLFVLRVPVSVISKPSVLTHVQETPSVAPVTTLPPPFLSTIPLVPHQTTTPIPTPPITTDALTNITVVSESDALSVVQLRVVKLEKDVFELKKIDHPAKALATLKSQVPTVVEQYLGSKIGDDLQKVLQRHTVDLIQKYSVKPAPESSKIQKPTIDLEQESEKSASEILKIKREQAYASDKGTATNKPKQQQQQLIPTTTTISNIKLPILKKEEYDIWAMEMEHYFEYINNDVWKVIHNGNSKKRISTGKDGIVRILPPVSAAEIHTVEKERKARTILLMAIPKEHLRRFHGMDDAKEIWEAIRTRFGGNANSKKMQKAVLKQQFEEFIISSSEGLEKGYDISLPPAWSNLAMTMRTKPDVDTLSINNFKSSNNKVKSGHTGPYSTYTPSTSSNNIPEREVPAGFADEVIYSLFAKQSEDLDLLHEDLEQIDDVDIEEMDINWQIAMIAIRMKKECPSKGTNDGKKRDSFYQDQGAGKKEQNQNCLLTMDDGVVNWGEHTVEEEETNHALMAISSNNEVSLCSKTCIDSYNKLKTLCDEQTNQLGEQEAKILAYTLAVKKLEAQVVTFQKQQLSLNEQLTFQANEIYAKDEKLKKYRRIGMKAVKEKEQLQKIVDSWKNSSKNLWKLVDSGMTSNSKVGLGYEIQSNNEVLSYKEEMKRTVFKCTEEDFLNKPLYSRFSKTDNFKGVPHPLTRDYTPKPKEEIDDSLYVYGKKGTLKA